jgi:hypothetical protein
MASRTGCKPQTSARGAAHGLARSSTLRHERLVDLAANAGGGERIGSVADGPPTTTQSAPRPIASRALIVRF